MLDVLNRLADGFVAVPVIDACLRGGVFSALAAGSRSAEELSRELGANEGHLRVALRLLDGLGWVDKLPDGVFRLSPMGEVLISDIPAGLHEMLKSSPREVASPGPSLAALFGHY